MNEDKQAILNAFLPALKLTRAGKDVVKLTYDKDREVVVISYRFGYDEANVVLDSGISMIQDVAKAVAYG